MEIEWVRGGKAIASETDTKEEEEMKRGNPDCNVISEL